MDASEILIPLASALAAVIGAGPVIFRYIAKQHGDQIRQLSEAIKNRDARITRLEGQMSEIQGEMVRLLRDEILRNAQGMESLKRTIEDSANRLAVCPHHTPTPRPL